MCEGSDQDQRTRCLYSNEREYDSEKRDSSAIASSEHTVRPKY